MKDKKRHSKLLLGLAVAFIFALLLSVGLTYALPRYACAVPNQDFYGWYLTDRTPGYPNWTGDWVKGNIGGEWYEGDWVSYILVLDGYGGSVLPPIDIAFDFYKPDAVFVDLLKNFYYKIRDPYPSPGKPNDVTPASVSTTWGGIPFTPQVINEVYPAGTSDNQVSPPGKAYWRLSPNIAFNDPIPAGKSVVIYFEARLAPSVIWQAGQEYLLNEPPTATWGGDRYDDWNTPHDGSSYVAGASRHFYLEAEGVGEKKIPIPVGFLPTGEISGTKYNDLNSDGVKDTGEPGLAGWTITASKEMDGIPFTRSATTSSDGSYVFTGLSAGTYTVSEVPQSCWSQTAPGLAGTHIIDLLEGQVVTGIDFGNHQRSPACHITATPGTTVCQGVTVTLTEDGGDAVSWLWSTTETTQSIDVTAGGTYSVTVTDANGCISTCQIVVTVNPTPDCHITATPGTTVCQGVTVTLTEDGGDAVSWLWSTAETTQSINVTAGGTYSVTVTDANGCIGSCDVVVTVVSRITATASSNSPVCEGDTIELYGGPDGMATYNWIGPNGFVSSLQNPSIAGATLDMEGTYTLTVTNSGCPSDPVTIDVTIHTLPDCTIDVPSVAFFTCSTVQTASVADAGDGASYNWTVTGGVITAGQGTNRIFWIALPGVVKIEVTVTDSNGFSSTCQVDVSVIYLLDDGVEQGCQPQPCGTTA
jgi:hypothetical protein